MATVRTTGPVANARAPAPADAVAIISITTTFLHTNSSSCYEETSHRKKSSKQQMAKPQKMERKNSATELMHTNNNLACNELAFFRGLAVLLQRQDTTGRRISGNSTGSSTSIEIAAQQHILLHPQKQTNHGFFFSLFPNFVISKIWGIFPKNLHPQK
jgi:hypothetical protein